jgi:DNA mismatch endonuclease (patch repair protein)
LRTSWNRLPEDLRDAKKEAALLGAGWRVMTVWECTLRGKIAQPEEVAVAIRKWLRSSARRGRVGDPPAPLLADAMRAPS